MDLLWTDNSSNNLKISGNLDANTAPEMTQSIEAGMNSHNLTPCSRRESMVRS